MSVDQQLAESSKILATHLRLKRCFLLTLVISLAVSALVAIGALLFSQFNQTTARILGTLTSLGFHSGIAMTCAASLERRRWPALSIAGLILFSINFAVMMICIWWPGVDDENIFWSILTTLNLLGYYILSIPCVVLFQRRRWRPLPQISLAVCTIALLMVLVCIWSKGDVSESFAKSTAIAGVIAFSLAHNCLLGIVPAAPVLNWLLTLASVSLWLMATIIIYMILGEDYDKDMLSRLAGAVGVLDAISTIALVIMAKVKYVETIEHLESTPARIEIHCPRCTTQQVVDAGASKCHECGLKFRIDISEPRCAKCGYLLWQLPQRRCPECGTTF